MVTATAAGGDIRCMSAVTTGLVSEAARRHLTSPTATAALGRTLTGALLLASTLKEIDRLTVQIVSDGPIGGITSEANGLGQVRGYVVNPEAEAPLNAKGKFDVGAVVGHGMFYVTRESGYEAGLYTDPYRGSVPLVSGEIAEDFAYYMTKSEQTPSAVTLGVLLKADTSGTAYVGAAGGVIIQAMPGANEKTLEQIERSLELGAQTTRLISEGATPVGLLRACLGPVEFELSGEERPLSFACSCSYKRAVSLISAIIPEELQSMFIEDKRAVLTCHFCNETYKLDEATLARLIEGQRSEVEGSSAAKKRDYV